MYPGKIEVFISLKGFESVVEWQVTIFLFCHMLHFSSPQPNVSKIGFTAWGQEDPNVVR